MIYYNAFKIFEKKKIITTNEIIRKLQTQSAFKVFKQCTYFYELFYGYFTIVVILVQYNIIIVYNTVFMNLRTTALSV